MSNQLTIYGYCDSLCESKGHSPMHVGYWAKDQNDNILFSKHEVVRNKSGQRIRSTNNQAEYFSLIALHNACWAWVFSNLCPSTSEPYEDRNASNQYAQYTNLLRAIENSKGEMTPSMQSKQELLQKIDKETVLFAKRLKKDGLCADTADEVALYATRIAFEANEVFQADDIYNVYQKLGYDNFQILFYMRKKAYKNKASFTNPDSVLEEVNRHKHFILNENNLSLHFHTDSNLMFSQLCGLPGIGNKDIPWKVKNPGLITLYNQVADLKAKLNFTLEWIPREENERANQLAENQVGRDNFKKVMYESNSRQAEVVDVKRSVNDLPETAFVADYFNSPLPELKEQFLDLLQESTVDWSSIKTCFKAMNYQVAKLFKTLPSTPDLQQSRKMHAEAGALAKSTLQLLDKDYRGRFNGPFISLIMNLWRSNQEIAPDELANLANKSIEHDKDNPCAWFHNLVRIHSPVNSELLQNAFNLLMQEMSVFESNIDNKDIDELKLNVSEFFGRLNLAPLHTVSSKEDLWNESEIESFSIETEETYV